MKINIILKYITLCLLGCFFFAFCMVIAEKLGVEFNNLFSFIISGLWGGYIYQCAIIEIKKLR